MAIAFSQVAGVTAQTASGTSHTLVSGASISSLTNGVAMVWVEQYSNATPTSVSWGGVAMTEITTSQYNSQLARKYSLWYLLNPGTGTINITATTASATILDCQWMTLSGVSQSAPTILDSSDGTNTVARTTMTTVDNNSWIAAFYVNGNNPSPAPTVDANTTLRNNYLNYWGVFTAGPITPAASTTAGVSAMSSGEVTVNALVFSPYASAGSTFAPRMSLLGVGR